VNRSGLRNIAGEFSLRDIQVAIGGSAWAIAGFLAFPMTPAGARAPESGQARSLKNSRANRRVTSEHRQWFADTCGTERRQAE